MLDNPHPSALWLGIKEKGSKNLHFFSKYDRQLVLHITLPDPLLPRRPAQLAKPHGAAAGVQPANCAGEFTLRRID